MRQLNWAKEKYFEINIMVYSRNEEYNCLEYFKLTKTHSKCFLHHQLHVRSVHLTTRISHEHVYLWIKSQWLYHNDSWIIFYFTLILVISSFVIIEIENTGEVNENLHNHDYVSLIFITV